MTKWRSVVLAIFAGALAIPLWLTAQETINRNFATPATLPINLASGSSVTGTLPLARGGTGLTAATDDQVMVGNGSAWQSKAVPDCDDTGGNHLNYDTTGNTFSCGTSGASTATSGSFTITWDDGCTTSPTTAINWHQSNNVVTWHVGIMSPTTCTGDSTTMSTTATIVPAEIRPTTAQLVIGTFSINNASADLASCLHIRTDGTVAASQAGIGCPANLTNWTASGTRAVNTAHATTVTYTLD